MRDKKGIALILAVGILALLAGIATSFALNMRLEYKAAINYYNGIKANYLAEAAIERAIYELKAHVQTSAFDDLTEDWAATAYQDDIDGDTVDDATSEILDEQRKVNVNTANQDLLENLFEELGMSSADASDVYDKINDNRPTDGYISIQELRSIGTLTEAEFNTIKDDVTVSSYEDAHTSRSPVNINTCSEDVLKAILTDLSDGTTTVSTTTVNSVVTAIQNAIPITTWADFDLAADGSASAAEAEVIKDNCNPNRTSPVTYTTEFCFNSGGYYEITGTGDVLISGINIAQKKAKAIVKIYDIYAQTTKEDFKDEDLDGDNSYDASLSEASAGLDYNEDGDISDTVDEDVNGNGVFDRATYDKVTWLDSCPVESTDLFSIYSVPSNARTILGSLKLGYWDDFENITQAYTRIQLQALSGNWSFENADSSDSDLEMWRKWGTSPADWGKYAFSSTRWNFGDFSLRLFEKDSGWGGPFKNEGWLLFRGIVPMDPCLLLTNGGNIEWGGTYAYWVNVIDPNDPTGMTRLPGPDPANYEWTHDVAGQLVRRIYYASDSRAASPQPTDQWYPAPLIERANYNEHLRLWPNSNRTQIGNWNVEAAIDYHQPVEYYADHPLSGSPNSDKKTYNLFIQSSTVDAYVYTSSSDPGGYVTNSMLPINVSNSVGRIGFYANSCYPCWDDLRIISDSGTYISKNLRPHDVTPDIDVNDEVNWCTIAATVTIPATAAAGSETVTLRTRSTNTAVVPTTQDIWRSLSGDASDSLDGTYIQYEATLNTNDADLSETPVLEDITITYLPNSKMASYTRSP